MRRLLLALGLVLGCAPQKPEVPVAPDAPVLSVPATSNRWKTTLRGVAPEGTRVRLYFDDACAGPSFDEVSVDALANGIDLALVVGVPNVITAQAVGPTGLVSTCSEPVRVTLEGIGLTSTPSISVSPPSPSRKTTFVITGIATPGSRVRLHELSCLGPVVEELTPMEYETRGFTVQIQRNETHGWVVDAIDSFDEVTGCSNSVLTVNDSLAPRYAQFRIMSPNPSTRTLAWVRASGDFTHAQFVLAAACAGAPELVPDAGFRCSGFSDCTQLVEFPADASTYWSLDAEDQAGNRTCFDGTEPWVHDPAGPPQPVQLIGDSSFGFDVLVPADVWWVSFFASQDCSGVPLQTNDAANLVRYQQSLPNPDGGAISARAVNYLGDTTEPCSNWLVH
jgi:hypothetical protein